MRKAMLALVAATLMLTACNDYGTKVSAGTNSAVYYKGEGVTEADAQKLGDYLWQQGFFDSSKAGTVQLLKDKDAYVVKMVIDEAEVARDKAFYKRFFWYLQQPLTDSVFKGTNTKIVFADDQLNDLEPVGAIAKWATFPNNRVLYNPDGITKDEATRLNQFLIEAGFFNGSKEVDILLHKDQNAYNVRFLVDEAALNQDKEDIVLVFKVYKYMMGQGVFNGQKMNAYLTSLQLQDLEPIADLTAEEKAAVDEANAQSIISGAQPVSNHTTGQ